MRRWRVLVVATSIACVAVSCSSAAVDDGAVSSSSTAATTTTAPLQPTTSTSPPPATTTATPAAVASDAEILLFGLADASYTTSPELSWVWGDVSAEAQVTINGNAVSTAHIGSTVFGPDWWRFNEDPEVSVTVPLLQGENTVTVTATFTDDSQLSRSVQVWSDPTLVESEGYLVELTNDDPPISTIEEVAFVHDEWGISDPGTGSTTRRLPVAADAVFIVIPWQGAFSTALSLSDMLPIQEANEIGSLEGYWYQEFFALLANERETFPAPWVFLITENGQLQQATQLYSP